MNKHLRLTGLLAGAIVVAAACSSTGASTAPSVAPSTAPSEAASMAPSDAASPTVDPASLLGQILKTGTIRIATDPNYAPYSFLNTTTNEYEGFDTSTAEEVVKRLSEKLGTEIKLQWETPGWDTITAGSWGGRWDISIGSMSVTVGRAKVVDFTEPYYFDFGSIVVPTASTAQTVADLDGKSLCVGTATTYEQWLNGTLEIVDPNIVTPPVNPEITALPTDNECIQAVIAGRTYDGIVGNSNSNADAIAKGAPLRVLDGPPIFSVSVAFALDKSGPSTESILPILNEIVTEMHADGTLKGFSMEWLKQDVTTRPE
jgi:polar amino acid transport system substrate-binding protein